MLFSVFIIKIFNAIFNISCFPYCHFIFLTIIVTTKTNAFQSAPFLPQDKGTFSWRLSNTTLTRVKNVKKKNCAYYIPILGGHRFGVGVGDGDDFDVVSGGYLQIPAI
jgi:hypothetical protein